MTHLEQLLQKATNPTAYDAQDTDWVIENGRDSSRQEIYREYFMPFRDKWAGKDVLDVGSGAGWLLNFFASTGARSVMGIEPSQKNVAASRMLYPDVPVVTSDFMQAAPERTYDYVTAVMVLTNMQDPGAAITQFGNFMDEQAELVIVVPDFDYFKTPRHNYELDMASINDDEYVIEIKRPTTVLTDIVRREHVYEAAARNSGLRLIESIPMSPTEDFSRKLAQYDKFKEKPIMHMMRFTKLS